MGTTLIKEDALTSPQLAVIVAEPTAKAVMVPELSTATIDSLSEVQTIVLSVVFSG